MRLLLKWQVILFIRRNIEGKGKLKHGEAGIIY